MITMIIAIDNPHFRKKAPILVVLVVDLRREELFYIAETARVARSQTGAYEAPGTIRQTEPDGAAPRRAFERRLLRPEIRSEIVFPGITNRRSALPQRDIPFVGGISAGSRQHHETCTVFADDVDVSVVIRLRAGIIDIPQPGPGLGGISRFGCMGIECPEIIAE